MQADLLGAAPVEVRPVHVKDLHYGISECIHAWQAIADEYLGSPVSARQLETPATPPSPGNQVAPSFAALFIWSMAILSATGKSGWAAVHTSTHATALCGPVQRFLLPRPCSQRRRPLLPLHEERRPLPPPPSRPRHSPHPSSVG
jgi:hypothetical protein